MRQSMLRVRLPQNSSRQGIVQVCACRSGSRDGSVGSLMPAKRALSAALALLLAVSFAAPSGARAASAGGFNYTLTGSAATVTGCTSTCPATLVIPGTLDGYTVTTIDDSAFNAESLVALTIPSTVTSIGNFAFSANLLTTLTIPNSVTSIGASAFDFNRLTTVTISNSVTSINP